MRTGLLFAHMRRRMTPVVVLTIAVSAAAMSPASAGFFDFLFGTPDQAPEPQERSAPQAATGAGPQAPLPPIGYARSTGHCVRLCDGMHFPVHGRGEMSPTAMCQAFCPASATKVFFGGQIGRAVAMDGKRYAELDNAYAYRKKLSTDCTCNGRDPGGLAPIDIALDTSLRPGDVVATTTGLVAFSSERSAGIQPGEFTPVASYAGLTLATRARLGEIRVEPVHAEMIEDTTASIEAARAMRDVKPRPSLN